MNALAKLHAEDYVHGDIRKENLLFRRNGINAWIIDFDLAGKEGTLYPSTYNHRGIDEHHSAAISLLPRKRSIIDMLYRLSSIRTSSTVKLMNS